MLSSLFLSDFLSGLSPELELSDPFLSGSIILEELNSFNPIEVLFLLFTTLKSEESYLLN